MTIQMTQTLQERRHGLIHAVDIGEKRRVIFVKTHARRHLQYVFYRDSVIPRIFEFVYILRNGILNTVDMALGDGDAE